MDKRLTYTSVSRKKSGFRYFTSTLWPSLWVKVMVSCTLWKPTIVPNFKIPISVVSEICERVQFLKHDPDLSPGQGQTSDFCVNDLVFLKSNLYKKFQVHGPLILWELAAEKRQFSTLKVWHFNLLTRIQGHMDHAFKPSIYTLCSSHVSNIKY